jgi:serine protease
MRDCLTRLARIVLFGICSTFVARARIYRSFDHDQSLYRPPSSNDYSGVLVVKFRNGSNLTTTQDGFQSAVPGDANDLAYIREALVRAKGNSPERQFTRPVNDLQAERTVAERNIGEELSDLTQFFTLRVADYAAARELLETMRTNRLVEVVYARSLPVRPPTPDFTSYQTYFASAASHGYDVTYARTRPGGDGSKARLIDIEFQWMLGHEDLQKNLTNILWGTQYTNYGPDHGTAALGVSAAINNNYGMTGIIYNGRIDMICSTDSGGNWVLADAINQATSLTAPGDVILLEQQGYSYGLTNYCPVEYYPDVYSAIATATALNRVIIEPAGNGSLNLDDPTWGGIFQRATRDSGAIIVGAGAAANQSRCSFSCYGTRVDIQGWGDWSVATLGYGDLYGWSETNYYTGTFSGTSSASALSAGVAALIQSCARASYGFSLPALLLRSSLIQGGYPQTYGLVGNIGPLPNINNTMVAADALLPLRITSISKTNTTDVLVAWTTVGGLNYALQTNDLLAGGDFGDFGSVIQVPGFLVSTTNSLDVGGSQNHMSRFYRVRLVP